MKKILSKSQANTYLDCPYKWKRIYIDKEYSKPSPPQLRGIKIHSKIEKAYNDIKLEPQPNSKIPKIIRKDDEELKNLFIFDDDRISSCVKPDGTFDIKYFKPLFQELRMKNEEIGLKGIVDAIYINPKDNKLIIIDWKTGQYNKKNLDDYRFELAVYAELLKHSDITDVEIGYIGIFFVDKNKLFFEELKQTDIDKMYETIEKVREGIKSEMYLPKKNKWCFFCQFKNECPLMKK